MLYATVRQRKIYVKNPVTVIQNGRNVDELTLNMDDEWAKMDSISCVFTLKYKVAVEQDGGETVYEDKEVVKQVEHTFGETITVPWECLVETGLLSMSCTGYVSGEKVMTTMMPDSFWTVVQNGPMEGDDTIEATPTLYEQIVAAAGRANTAASAAEQTNSEILKDKESGAFDGISPTVEVDSVTTGAAGTSAQVENVGTPQAVKLRFVIPRGATGAAGAAGRGISQMTYSDGDWIVTYTDGTRQVVGGKPENQKDVGFPVVREVSILNGQLVVAMSLGDGKLYTEFYDFPAGSGGAAATKLSQLESDADHRTVTDEQIETWNNKPDSWYNLPDKPILPERLTSNGLDGNLLIRNTNDTLESVGILPNISGAATGAFLRIDSDGYLAWESLTDVSKEGA